MTTAYRIEIRTWDNVVGDGVRTVVRPLTDAEVAHVVHSVNDPDSPVCGIERVEQ